MIKIKQMKNALNNSCSLMFLNWVRVIPILSFPPELFWERIWKFQKLKMNILQFQSRSKISICPKYKRQIAKKKSQYWTQSRFQSFRKWMFFRPKERKPRLVWALITKKNSNFLQLISNNSLFNQWGIWV